MPRAFLVKRRSQCGASDDMHAQVLNKGLKLRPFSSSKFPASEIFDFHEVDLFNKCHSQFHQRHFPIDLLSGVRHLEYNKSICEQVNSYKKEELINDYPIDFSKQTEMNVQKSPTSTDTADFRRQSTDVKSVHQEMKDNVSENQFPKTRRTTVMPTNVSQILANQRQKILAKHIVNIQSGFFDLKKFSRRGRNNARQPIAGLEYIQNGTDMQYRNMAASVNSQEIESSSTENVQITDGQNSESEEKQSQQRKYVCDICNKGFSRSNTLVTHKRIHTGDKPFECEVCGRAFRQPGNLTRHRLIHTTVKPYKCSQCGKAFNRASNLHTHMRTHTNYKPFVCQYCGKGFHQKIDMKIHSYTHTGEKPHKCKKCGRGFKQLTHLTYHMRTHSDVKMYTCTYCGKGFNQKGNLQAHIYGHTGERPYRCELCGKGFTLASTLNTHRRTHTNRLAIPTFESKNKTLSYDALKH